MIQYLTDERGKKTAVQVPIDEWEALQRRLKKEEVLNGVREAVQEYNELSKAGKLKSMGREEFMQTLMQDAEGE